MTLPRGIARPWGSSLGLWKGFSKATPVARKSALLCVTTVRTCCRAIAAICLSSACSGWGTRRRPQSWAASLSHQQLPQGREGHLLGPLYRHRVCIQLLRGGMERQARKDDEPQGNGLCRLPVPGQRGKQSGRRGVKSGAEKSHIQLCRVLSTTKNQAPVWSQKK
jgi:hypothetical protein